MNLRDITMSQLYMYLSYKAVQTEGGVIKTDEVIEIDEEELLGKLLLETRKYDTRKRMNAFANLSRGYSIIELLSQDAETTENFDNLQIHDKVDVIKRILRASLEV